MKNRPVAVFGGTGFLGRRIVARLIEAGYPVRLVARRPHLLDELVAARDQVECLAVDIREPAAVEQALQGAGAAVNAVSLYVKTRNGPSFDEIHVAGAERLARLASDAGVARLVHVSGIGVDEASPSAYVRARARGEACVRRAFPSVTVLRPSVIFGPDDAFLSALRLLAGMPLVPLFGRGNTRLQPVHVADVAEAVVRSLWLEESAGRVYELGGATVYRYRELLRLAQRHRGRRGLLLPLPFALWRLLAGFLSLLPSPPLTADQVWLMQEDNVVNAGASGFESLGIRPRPISDSLAPAQSDQAGP